GGACGAGPRPRRARASAVPPRQPGRKAMQSPEARQGTFSFDRHLRRVGVVVPEALDLGLVGGAVGDDEAIARDVRLARLDGPVAELAGGVAEERLVGVEAHRLGEAEVVGVAEDRHAGHLAALDLAADPAPFAAGLIAVATVAPFAGEEGAVVLAVPVPAAAEAEAAVEVLREDQWAFAGAGLSGHPVERVVGALTLARAVA